MSRVPALISLFVMALLVCLVVTMPLAFVLKPPSGTNADFQWEKTSGTVWNGTLYGLLFRSQQSLGDIDLAARPLALFGGELGHDFIWNGAPGQGTGALFLGRNSVRVSDANLQINIEGVIDLRTNIRNTNAVVNISNANLAFKDDDCTSATGDISSDVLSKLAMRHNVQGTDLTGNISCVDDALLIAVRGQAGENDLVTADLHIRPNGVSSMKIHVQTADLALGLGLAQYGFEEDETGYVLQSAMSF